MRAFFRGLLPRVAVVLFGGWIAMNSLRAAAVTWTLANAAPVYQWSKDGVFIADATAATLQLSNVKTADAADYTVTATNPSGTTTSPPAALTVASLTITANAIPVVGGAIELAVEAIPGATYQWRHKGLAPPLPRCR